MVSILLRFWATERKLKKEHPSPLSIEYDQNWIYDAFFPRIQP